MLSDRLELTRFPSAGSLHGGSAGSGTIRMMCPGRGQGGVPPWQNGHGEAPVGQSQLTSWSQGQVGCTGAPATQRPAHTWVLGREKACFWVSGIRSWAEMHCPLDGTPAICLEWTRRTEASNVRRASVLVSPRTPCPQPRPGFLRLEIPC